MKTALLLLSSVMCPPRYYPPHLYYPFYYPQAYNLRMPTPSSLRPPNFKLYPAPPQPPRAKVEVPPYVYEGVMPLTIENPYYKPAE